MKDSCKVLKWTALQFFRKNGTSPHTRKEKYYIDRVKNKVQEYEAVSKLDELAHKLICKKNTDFSKRWEQNRQKFHQVGQNDQKNEKLKRVTNYILDTT